TKYAIDKDEEGNYFGNRTAPARVGDCYCGDSGFDQQDGCAYRMYDIPRVDNIDSIVRDQIPAVNADVEYEINRTLLLKVLDTCNDEVRDQLGIRIKCTAILTAKSKPDKKPLILRFVPQSCDLPK